MASLSRKTLALLYLLALIPRIALLAEFGDSDYFDYPSVDEEEYRQWALEIADGDVLGSEIFYGSPVYPYFLGSVFSVFGSDLFMPRLIQVGLGAARAPIMAAVGTVAFGPVVGVATGVLVALYRTTLFYDVFLLKEGLALFLQDVALLLLLLALRRGDAAGPRLLLGAGFLVGLAALAREFLAPFIGLAAVLLALRSRRRAVAGGLFVAGALLALLPVAARNYFVAGEFVLLSSQGGQNFYLGNGSGNTSGLVTFPRNVRSDPNTLEEDFRALATHRTGRVLGPSEASDFWFREALREMAAEPLRALALFGRKALLSVSAFEVPNVLSIEYFARHSRVLRWDPVRWGLLLPLAVVGIAMALGEPGRRREALAPLLLLGTVFFALVAFYVSDRYRLPAVAPLALFAGGGLVGLARALRTRSWAAPGGARRAALAAGAIAAVAALMHLPLLPSASRGDAMPPANLANALARDGRPEDALAYYEEAFEIEPDTDFALYGIAILYADQGRYRESLEALGKYIAKNPSSSKAYYNLGTTYFEMGHPDTAAMAFGQAIRLQPYYHEAHFNLGAVRQQMGDLAGARAAYEAAVQIAPRLFRAWNNLGTVLTRQGESAAADAAFRQAFADTAYVEPRMNLAELLLDTGHPAEAVPLYEWVLSRRNLREALFGLGKAHAATGNPTAAREPLELYLRLTPPTDPTHPQAQALLK